MTECEIEDCGAGGRHNVKLRIVVLTAEHKIEDCGAC